MDPVRAAATAARTALSFMTIEQTAALIERGGFVLDPFAPLIGPDLRVRAGIMLWPNTSLAHAVASTG